MHRYTLRVLALVLAFPALALVGCDSADENPPTEALGGAYTGPYFDGTTTTITIPAGSRNGSLSVSGTFDFGEGDGPQTVSGTAVYNFPNISFDFGGGIDPTGIVSNDFDVITLSEAGETFVLTRE